MTACRIPNFFWRRCAGNGSSSEFPICALRVDPTLALPDVNDNLESRLSLRRERLQRPWPELRIVPVARGRFALRTGAPLVER
jgi:adenylate cyclase